VENVMGGVAAPEDGGEFSLDEGSDDEDEAL